MVDVLLGLNAVAPMEFWDPVENMEDHGDIKGIHSLDTTLVFCLAL